MYKNIGGKIKGLAIALFVFLTVGGVIAGIVLFAVGTILGLVPFFGGFPVGLIMSWPLYGYGELIQNVDYIANKSRKDN